MKKAVSHVPALERGLKLLEWMAVREEPVTLTQIARGLGLGIPEVQRPVACLEDAGYLRHLPSGGYVLSGKLFGLAGLHPPLLRLRRAAEPVLMEFARRTGQSIHLSIPDGEAALMILDVPGEGLVRLSLQPGARFHPSETLSGALLALAGSIPKPSGFRAPAALVRAIRAAKPFAWESRQVAGVLDIGTLLSDRDGRIVGALTSSTLNLKNGKFSPSRMESEVQRTARQLAGVL